MRRGMTMCEHDVDRGEVYYEVSRLFKKAGQATGSICKKCVLEGKLKMVAVDSDNNEIELLHIKRKVAQ